MEAAQEPRRGPLPAGSSQGQEGLFSAPGMLLLWQGCSLRTSELNTFTTWFSRLGGVELTVGLHDLRGLFQPQ